MALSASAAWGVSDFLGGLKAKTVSVSSVLLISQTAGLVLVVAVLIASGQALPRDPRLALALLAGVWAVIDLGLIYLVLARGPVILIAPIAAVGASIPVVVGIAGGDPTSPAILLGLALALAGSLAASYEPPDDEREGGLLAGLPLALGAAVGIGMALILLDRASDVHPLWATGALRVGGFGTAGLLALFVAVRRARRSESEGPGLRGILPVGILATLAAVGLFDVLADLGYTYASTSGDLSTVSVLASLYPVVTVMLGYAVLREHPLPTQLAGVALALAGIALLATC
jgi:drug/metabolite transporter (DMT)-like permease